MRSFRHCLRAFTLILLLLMPTLLMAENLRQHCNNRCRGNRALCLGSTLPALGGNAGGNCTSDCMDAYLECDSDCAASDAACTRACNGSLASCTRGCSSGTAGCNDGFVACQRSCTAVPQCTNDAHCSGGACVSGTCEAACRTNAQCQRKLGPDGICFKPNGALAKRCVSS